MKLSVFLFLMLKDSYDWNVSEADIAYDIKDPLFLVYGDYEKIETHFLNIVRNVDSDFLTKYYKDSNSLKLEFLKNKITFEGASDEEIKVLSEKVESYIKEIMPSLKNIQHVDFSGTEA